MWKAPVFNPVLRELLTNNNDDDNINEHETGVYENLQVNGNDTIKLHTFSSKEIYLRSNIPNKDLFSLSQVSIL